MNMDSVWPPAVERRLSLARRQPAQDSRQREWQHSGSAAQRAYSADYRSGHAAHRRAIPRGLPSVAPNRTDIVPRALNTNAPQTIDTDNAGGRLDQLVGSRDRLTLRFTLTSQQVNAFELSCRAESGHMYIIYELFSYNSVLIIL